MTKIALVTGGGRGIGRSAALNIAARGLDVVITYRSDAASAHATIAELAQHGRRGVALPLDLAHTDGFDAAMRTALHAWARERFDVLVHNAGDGVYGPLAELPAADLERMLDLHLKAPLRLTQQLLPLLADGGAIVQISTGLTRYTYPGAGAYAIAKAAMETAVRYLARELGPRGITVNSIAPGGVATDFGGGIMRDAQVQSHVLGQTPLGRIAQPDDIGAIVAAIAAGDLGWATGQRIEATGGYAL